MHKMDERIGEAQVTRRSLLTGGVAGIVAAVSARALFADEPAPDEGAVITKGRLNQGVCKWCYGALSVEKLAQAAQAMGLKGMDLVDPKDWPTLKKYGLVCSMANSHSIPKGFNRVENHAECIAAVRRGIDACADAGYPNVICFSGNRAGLDDDTGLKNCVTGLKQIVGYAEEKKVTICMELLNSKRNHKDYMCDKSIWGVALCKAVGSERFKLLYDIYHMQIDEGDVIATIRDNRQYYGHFHTGGNPGRNEIDDSQELNYAAIARAVAEKGYTGFLSHEFIPRNKDVIKSLRAAARLCDV
jgi:hydroxypyruvate isomerase